MHACNSGDIEGCDMREALMMRAIRFTSETVAYSSVDLFLGVKIRWLLFQVNLTRNHIHLFPICVFVDRSIRSTKSIVLVGVR